MNNALELKGKDTHFRGTMQCFCKFQKEIKAEKTKIYIPSSGEGLPVCQTFNSDKLRSLVLGQSVAFIIIAINTILKIVIIKGIEWVGEDTNSEQLASITNGIFVAQFFNTGILILLVNGNMSEHAPKFLTKFVVSTFYDYSPEWYETVGFKIVQTMIINSIIPYVTLGTSFVIPRILRGLDNKFTNSFYNTRKTSLSAYRDVYSGKDYYIHYKYSNIFNIVYITFMYGVGMPILFPVAALNFIN